MGKPGPREEPGPEGEGGGCSHAGEASRAQVAAAGHWRGWRGARGCDCHLDVVMMEARVGAEVTGSWGSLVPGGDTGRRGVGEG